jgi:hypothetical protein
MDGASAAVADDEYDVVADARSTLTVLKPFVNKN